MKEINPFDYSKEINESYRTGGILLLSKKKEGVNAMTIGWGMIGVLWAKPMFLVFVREGRDTKTYLDSYPYFTISAPLGKAPKEKILYCGTHHGEGRDKLKEAGLTLLKARKNGVGAIEELPLTLECHVLYSQQMEKESIPEEIQKRFYPENVDKGAVGSNKETHTLYFGEIVDSYILD